MKIKFVVAAGVGALAFAGIAQGAGMFNHEDEHLNQLQRREVVLEQNFAQPSAGISRARRGPKGARGARGPKGAAGAPGAPGPKGTFGSISSVSSAPTFLCSFETGPCAVGSAGVTCPPGTTLVGGGYTGAGILTTVTYDAPSGANSWGVIGVNFDEVSVANFRAVAQCASP